MKSHQVMFAAALFVAAFATNAGADTISSSGRGFYRADGSNPNNGNYVVGHANGSVVRNWFTFNLPTPPLGQGVVSAMLRTSAFDVSENLTVTLYDFTGSVPGLASITEADDAAGVARFNDLGSGTVYGSRSFTHVDTNQTVSYSLNGDALAAINANLGSAFAIGGASNVESHIGVFAYGSSQIGNSSAVQLILEYGDVSTIPLPPAAWAGLSTLATIGLAGFIRRRHRLA